MTVINLPARDRVEAEILTLAYEVLQRAEKNPAGAGVALIARRIADSAEALARDRAEAEILTLAHELVQRAEENPSAAVVAQLARRIADTADALARP